MKPQDILFIIVLALLLWKNNPKWLAIAGLLCLLFSIPLFQLWVFFTAQHLVWYASAFFLASVCVFRFKR